MSSRQHPVRVENPLLCRLPNLASLGALAVVLLALLVPSSSRANFITANSTIDLRQAITGSTWTGFAHPLDSPVAVTSGDTVTINIDFLGDQTLTWQSDDYFSPWLMLTGYAPGGDPEDFSAFPPGQQGRFNWFDTSVTLHNLTQGTQFPPAQLIGGSGASAHLGPTLTLGNDNVTRTFSGATVTFTATWTEGDATRNYSTVGYHQFPLVGFGPVSFTPEPGGLALLALGGLLLRRHGRRRPSW